MNSKMYLASVGWVADAPEGNRLRWSYPAGEPAKPGVDKFLGFPEVILVERAPVEEDIPKDQSIQTSAGGALFPAAATIPTSWWDHHGTLNLTGRWILKHRLPTPVQAVAFTYHGAKSRMVVRDSQRDQLVAVRILSNGDTVYLEGSAIDDFFFLGNSVTLEDFRTLDLFKDRRLKWETIAEIHVAETSGSTRADVRKRYTVPSTLSTGEWEELVKLARLAQDSTPSTIIPGEPTPWQAFDLTLGTRWEFALLYGYAFFDGPHIETSPLDLIDESKLLKRTPPRAVAYRVREKAGRVAESNVVVCPAWRAAPLVSPSIPQYIDPEVRLTIEGKFEATVTMRWQQFDARAIGVEFEEEIGKSPSINSDAQTSTFESRSQRPEEPAFTGEIIRQFDVAFHDVPLSARARATDAWDRVSMFSAWSSPTSLKLRHEPPAPTLASARYESGQVRITRQVGDPSFPDWHPDIIVTQHSGRVFVCRQIAQPRAEDVVAGEPTPVEGLLYKTTIPGVTNSSDFANGYVIAGTVKASVTEISGDDFFFNAPYEGGGSVTLFTSGPAKLQQNPLDEDLWLKVAEYPAVGLPQELVFSDPVPGPVDQADVLSYYARISYLGLLGPASNVVHAFRVPPTPVVPPPFTVETLGIDFYNRTMVKIRLTNPVSGGLYSVWWADGQVTNSDFGSQAVPGEYGAQAPQENRFLYDTLSVPIPQHVDRTITIGVQQVNQAEGQSNFQTVQIVLHAP